MRNAIIGLFFSIFLLSGSVCVFAAEEFLVADFNDGQAMNKREKPFEIWLKGDGSDATQSCKMSISDDDALAAAGGHSLRLDYDVDSPEPAYNGARTDLNSFDASAYKSLVLYLKGDAQAGFPKNVKIELIGPDQRPSPFIINGVTAEWQKFTVPFSSFFLVKDWTKLQKFVVVFADIVSDPKTGSIYLDQIAFSKE